MSGISTPNLGLAAVLDDVLGNAEIAPGVTGTARVPVSDFAEQLLAGGPIAEKVLDLETLATTGDGTVSFKTYAALAAVTNRAVGTTGGVYGPDAGTHTDPVVGGTVNNVGRYRWSASPAGWEWLGDISDVALANRLTLLETISAPPIAGFGSRIVVDRHGEFGLAQVVYLPRRFYLKRGAQSSIFTGGTAPGTNSARLSGYHEVTYASTSTAYLIYFDAASGTAHADRFKSVAYTGSPPALDDDCIPVMVIDNGVVVLCWFEWEYASAPAEFHPYRALVLDGGKLLCPAGIYQTDTGAVIMTAPADGMFKQEVSWPPTPADKSYTLFFDAAANAAGSDPFLVAGYPKHPRNAFQIPVARWYSAHLRTLALGAVPIIGEVPGGSMPNLMAVGQNDVEDADLVYGSSDPCDITDADLVALGFTRGYNNAGSTFVYYGTKLYDFAPNRFAFVRVRIQTGVDNAFGTPKGYFVTPAQSGNQSFTLTLEKKLSARAAIYSGWAQMADNKVYDGIWVGTEGFLTTDDVRICGVQIGYGSEHRAWVARKDFPTKDASPQAKAKAAYAAAPAINDGPEILYTPDMWLIEGRPQQLIVPNLFEDRNEGGVAKVTFSAAPRNAGEPYYHAETNNGTIQIDPDKVGRSGQIIVRKTLSNLDKRWLNSVAINVAPPWTVRGATPKILIVGDSLTYQTGVPVMVKRKLALIGMAPTMLGTLSTIENGTSASTSAEGRPGVEAGQLINATVPNPTVLCSPLSAGAETSYTTTYTEAQRREANPFVRLAVGGDNPAFVYNGQIVDMANYFTRFGMSVADYMAFTAGTNDVGHATDDVELAAALTRFGASITIFATQMLVANPAAKVAVVCHPLPRSVAGDARWEGKQVALIKKAIETVAALVATGKAVTLLPVWAHASNEAGWPMGAGTTAFNQVATTLSDTLHYEGVTSDQIAEVIAAWIACQEAGTSSASAALGAPIEALNPNADFQVISGALPLAGPGARIWPVDNMGIQRQTSATGITVSEAVGEYGGRAIKIQRTAGDASTATINMVSFINPADVKRLRGKRCSIFVKAKAGANFSPTSGTVAATLRAVDSLAAIATDGTMAGNILLNPSALNIAAATTWKEGWKSCDTLVPATATVMFLRLAWTPTGVAGADDSITFEIAAAQETPVPAAHRPRLYSQERRLLAELASVRLSGVAADATFNVPAGYAIEAITIRNTTGNAVTGGIKIGTTAGGTDVVAAQAVGANSLVTVADAAILKRYFSATLETTLYFEDVTAWNSASLEVAVVVRPAV
jgi:hypothetical protein